MRAFTNYADVGFDALDILSGQLFNFFANLCFMPVKSYDITNLSGKAVKYRYFSSASFIDDCCLNAVAKRRLTLHCEQVYMVDYAVVLNNIIRYIV